MFYIIPHYKPNLFLICILIICMNVHFLFGQNQNIRFKSYTIDDGLSHNKIECIFQDKKGFMWFGTNEGLNRFDGLAFTVYKNNIIDCKSQMS